MNKNGVNTAYLAQAGFTKVVIKRDVPAKGFHSLHFTKTASASGNQARKRRNWIEVIQGALACLAMAAIFNVILINFLLYPDCNRVTRDCFLVQHLWGAK